jgi:phosphohistidine phosphatase SixA
MFKSLIALTLAWAIAGAQAQAQTLAGADLARALRQGGYVLLMRHASSPIAPPDKALAEPDNPKPERQLDGAGKAAARAMGQAVQALGIPVGQVESSPTYRALQTARLAQLPAPQTFAQLGEGGGGMQAQGADQGAWLRAKVAEPPRAGTDTVIITHLPNIRAAYPALGAGGVADGEALVFLPDGKGGAALAGRIRIEDWPALAGTKP